MCGVFGTFGHPVDDAQLVRVSELLGHRGPDDTGAAAVGDGVLVNRRLAIVDLGPSGHQPMASHDGSCWITYNGEIYNHVELRRELAPYYRFRTSSDTEVVLAAYERWGDACLARLRGMFAFGLWDGRRRRLLCATDRLSIKPLLYHDGGADFTFASEAKPMAAVGVPLEPDRDMLYEYLRYGLLDHADRTLFAGIRQLRPGTYLVRENGRVDVRRYWDLSGREEPWQGDASVEEIEATLQESVDIHLRGDVEPALSLSSGLDSNVLRALIQRSGHAPGLHCFTACFSGTPYDECARVGPLIAGADVVHHATEVPPDALLSRLASLVERMEGPVGGLGIYAYWLNSRAVSEAGFKVLVDGQGGDEAFAGYSYYLDAGGAGTQTAREGAAALSRAGGGAPAHPERVGPREQLNNAVRAPDGTLLTSDYVAPEFARAHGHEPPRLETPFADPLKAAMYRDLLFLKIPKLLRFQDRASMAWSVEVRVPYLDHVLLEKLYAAPAAELLAGGVTKAILRRIARARLRAPVEDVKLYVAAPQREWLKTLVAADVGALIRDSAFAADGYVDARALARQYDDYCASAELGNSFFVWKFVTLELWYRVFIARGARFHVGAGLEPGPRESR